MNYKPILQFGLTAATAFLAGGGVMYNLPKDSPKDQPIKAYPVSVTCEVKLPKQALDVYVHGANVR